MRRAKTGGKLAGRGRGLGRQGGRVIKEEISGR
jgi:hypothetical protein